MFSNLQYEIPTLIVLAVGIAAAARRSARGDRAARFALAGCLCLLVAHLVIGFSRLRDERGFWLPLIVPLGLFLSIALGFGLILTPILLGRSPDAPGGTPVGADRGPD